jgi:hypothetical protein
MKLGKNIQHSKYPLETLGAAQRTECGCVADQPQQCGQSGSLTNRDPLRLVLRTQPRSERNATHHQMKVRKGARWLFGMFPGTAGFLLTGCRSTHSPTVDVLGSYFPAWIICIVTGLVLTILTRQVLILLKLDKHIHPAPLVYLCLITSFTLLVWLMFFKN